MLKFLKERNEPDFRAVKSKLLFIWLWSSAWKSHERKSLTEDYTPHVKRIPERTLLTLYEVKPDLKGYCETQFVLLTHCMKWQRITQRQNNQTEKL